MNLEKSEVVKLLESQIKLVKGLKLIDVKEYKNKVKYKVSFLGDEGYEEFKIGYMKDRQILIIRDSISGLMFDFYMELKKYDMCDYWNSGEAWKDINNNIKEKNKYVYLIYKKYEENNEEEILGYKNSEEEAKEYCNTNNNSQYFLYVEYLYKKVKRL